MNVSGRARASSTNATPRGREVDVPRLDAAETFGAGDMGGDGGAHVRIGARVGTGWGNMLIRDFGKLEIHVLAAAGESGDRHGVGIRREEKAESYAYSDRL